MTACAEADGNANDGVLADPQSSSMHALATVLTSLLRRDVDSMM